MFVCYNDLYLSWVQKVVTSTEEDLVDPHETVRELCVTDHCAAVKAMLDECNARVESKNNMTENWFE